MRYLLLLGIWMLGLSVLSAQQGLRGQVVDSAGQLLPYVNVYLAGSTQGTTSNADGRFQLELDTGRQVLVFQYLGFEKKYLELYLRAGDWQEQEVVLAPSSLNLAEVVVEGGEDPAYRIIRKAIAQRKAHLNQVEAYQCKVYIKGMQQLLDAPKKVMGRDVDLNFVLDSNRQGVVYLSESLTTLSFRQPNSYKEEMHASKYSGNSNGFSWNSARAMDFSCYRNQVKVNDAKVISPIAQSALSYYRYRLEGSFEEEGEWVYKIEVVPKNPLSATFRGYIYIVEDDWRIHSTDLYTLGKAINIAVLDTFELQQSYLPVNDSVHLIFSNQVRFRINVLGFDLAGVFTGVFSDYRLNPAFPARFFNARVFEVADSANAKANSFWDSLRPIPLSPLEQNDYALKDSLEELQRSPAYLDSIDRAKNKFKWSSAFLGYRHQNSIKRQYWGFGPLVTGLQFNPVQGWNLRGRLFYRKEYDDLDLRWWDVRTRLEYGFADRTLRAELRWRYNFNRINYAQLELTAGNLLRQYNEEAPIRPVVNTLYSVFSKLNYAKLYEHEHIGLRYRQELFNGLFMWAGLSYSQNHPLRNSTNLSISDGDFDENLPVEPARLGDVLFNEWQFELRLRLRLGQKVIRYPNRKFFSSLPYPEMWLLYLRGLPFAGGDTDYSILSFSIVDDWDFGALGRSALNASVGGTLVQGFLPFTHQHHINGNRTIFSVYQPYLRSFYLAPYYEYSTAGFFAEAHYEHNFKGFLWKKIPLLKQLGFEILGSYHVYYTEEHGTYMELVGSINRIGWKAFRILRLDLALGRDPSGNWRFQPLVGLRFSL